MLNGYGLSKIDLVQLMQAVFEDNRDNCSEIYIDHECVKLQGKIQIYEYLYVVTKKKSMLLF